MAYRTGLIPCVVHAVLIAEIQRGNGAPDLRGEIDEVCDAQIEDNVAITNEALEQRALTITEPTALDILAPKGRFGGRHIELQRVGRAVGFHLRRLTKL